MSVPAATVLHGSTFEVRTHMVRCPVDSAVADCSNWRNVMRKLGLNASSAGAIRIVRRDVERLGLDTSHFRGKRIWTDSQLRRAVMDSLSWDELLDALGLAPGSGDGRIRVKAHAIRLGLDLSHPEPDYRGPGRHFAAYLHQLHRGQCGRAHGASPSPERAQERGARSGVGMRGGGAAGVDCPVCQLKENTSRARRRGFAIRSSCTRVRAEPRARRCGIPACRW